MPDIDLQWCTINVLYWLGEAVNNLMAHKPKCPSLSSGEVWFGMWGVGWVLSKSNHILLLQDIIPSTPTGPLDIFVDIFIFEVSKINDIELTMTFELYFDLIWKESRFVINETSDKWGPVGQGYVSVLSEFFHFRTGASWAQQTSSSHSGCQTFRSTSANSLRNDPSWPTLQVRLFTANHIIRWLEARQAQPRGFWLLAWNIQHKQLLSMIDLQAGGSHNVPHSLLHVALLWLVGVKQASQSDNSLFTRFIHKNRRHSGLNLI